MSRAAIIRADGHPMPELNAGCPMYVSRVGHRAAGRGRPFDLTTNKRHARSFDLKTAARVLRELDTSYQLSIADAPGA